MKRFAMLLVLLLASGCSSETVVVCWPPEAPEAMQGPMVAESQVEMRNGITYWKGTTNLFTGRTVGYDMGFFTTGFVNGNEVELPEEPEQKDLFPEDASYQQAMRDYVQENGPDHDTYFFFQEHGKEADIPILLYGLESMGETTRTRQTVVCTRLHCVEALQAITGAKPGINYSDWANWWKEKFKADPPRWKPKGK